MKIKEKVKEFFKEVWVEMKRVSWLTRKDVVKYTMIVLAVVIATSIFLGSLDYFFSFLIKSLILR